MANWRIDYCVPVVVVVVVVDVVVVDVVVVVDSANFVQINTSRVQRPQEIVK